MAELDLSIEEATLNRLADAAERAEKALASLHGLAHGGVRIEIAGELATVHVFALQTEYTLANTVEVGKCVKVTLDDKEIDDVIAADTRHGFVDVIVSEGRSLKFEGAGGFVTERKFGKVVVTPM